MRLLLMRHAKSSWKDSSLEDHQRPLNKRGKRDAPRMAAKLVELGWRPELVISSDSQRTRETWSLMVDLFSRAEVRFTRDLYMGDLDDILAALSGVSSSTSTVMVLGHNPGWEDALSTLAGVEESMTTANVALLEAELDDWSRAGTVRWQLASILRPKELWLLDV